MNMNISIANVKRGTIKQVTSGDSVVIQGKPRPDGPPLERQLNLAFVKAPKLERRPVDSKSSSKDEPWAWEAREFLRKKLIGKEVFFTADKAPNATRESGFIFVGKDLNHAENIVESIVSEGLVTLRGDPKNPEFQNLQKIEELAKAQGNGMHGSENAQDHVRKIEWNTDRDITKYNFRPVKAIIEHVRDGSTVRAFLMPDDTNTIYYITLMISGIRCPGTKLDASGKPDPTSDDPLAEEAKCFVEALLLQRDIEIILESVNNNNFVGSIVHPNGDIAELLLKKGFAKCVDWSIQYVKSGAATLRAAERFAKERKLKIWKDFVTNAPVVPQKDKEFTATVVEVINGDALMVKQANGSAKKIFLSSVRPPKEKTNDDEKAPTSKSKNFRPLYDIPYMFDAREYLRKTLVGKKVNVSMDYIQPARESLPEKQCCTVMLGKQNIAYELVSKGLATVVRYRQDDDQRSSHYDKLMEAESKALKAGVGVHSKKEVPLQKVPNISADVAMAKLSLAGLQRHPRLEAVVEFVASGSRLRLYIPKDSRLLTFLLAGITCPRGSRPGLNGTTQEAEPFGEEALLFTKERCLQREVTINVESMDKAGNFIGWLWIDDENLSIALVKNGLAQVHSTAERSSEHKMSLKAAEEHAKNNHLGMWKDYVEPPKEEEHHEEEKVQERKINLEKVVVTEVTSEGHFYAQNAEQGPKLEALTKKMHQELLSNPPVAGAYTPRRGDICAAKFSEDKQWYRAKVEKIQGSKVSILYIDYGNRETIDSSSCASLSPAFTSDKPYASEYSLACVNLPSDPDYKEFTIKSLKEELFKDSIFLNVESRGAVPDVTIYDSQRNDIVKNLLSEGLLLVDNKRDRRLQKLLTDYKAAQQIAKTNHYAIWEYGDITEDDAREFGAGR